VPRLAAVAILCGGGFFAASAQAADDPGGAPYFYGAWRPAQTYDLLQTSEGKPPPLTPAARAVYERNLAQRRKGDLAFDGMATLCQPPGIPRLLTRAPFWLFPIDDKVIFLSEWNQVMRPVYLHSKHQTHDLAPGELDNVYYLGDAVGEWDGDVLVVDSTSFRDSTLLDNALPHSESLHVVERIRLVDRNTLESAITITDPKTYTVPWTTVLRFRRLPSDRPAVEDVCTDRVVTPLTANAE
jgi:hypothetical protein